MLDCMHACMHAEEKTKRKVGQYRLQCPSYICIWLTLAHQKTRLWPGHFPGHIPGQGGGVIPESGCEVNVTSLPRQLSRQNGPVMNGVLPEHLEGHLDGVLPRHLEGHLDGVLPRHLEGHLDGVLPGWASGWGLPRHQDGGLPRIWPQRCSIHVANLIIVIVLLGKIPSRCPSKTPSRTEVPGRNYNQMPRQNPILMPKQNPIQMPFLKNLEKCPGFGVLSEVLPGHLDGSLAWTLRVLPGTWGFAWAHGVLPGHMDGVLPVRLDGSCLGTWMRFCPYPSIVDTYI